MMEEKTMNINELETMIKEHYGFKSVFIKKAKSGTRSSNIQYLDLGPGAILDIVVSVTRDKSDKERRLKVLEEHIRSLEGLMESQYDWINGFVEGLKGIDESLKEVLK